MNNLFGRVCAEDADVSKTFIMSTSILINHTKGSTPVCESLLPSCVCKRHWKATSVRR